MNLNTIHQYLFHLAPEDLCILKSSLDKMVLMNQELAEILKKEANIRQISITPSPNEANLKKIEKSPLLDGDLEKIIEDNPVDDKTCDLRSRNPRKNLKPAKSGSLRETIYKILQLAKGMPLSRAEIISRAAMARNCRATDNFKANVSEILRCKTDPRIRRVAHGIYTLANANEIECGK